MSGRSIRIFLADGTPQGIRTAEVGNWTGLALVGPRTDLARLGARKELARTGVYLLVGRSEQSDAAIYVGEGDEVWSRLKSHHADADKDWWTWAVVFVSKDDNLTKAHVRWLEARLVAEIAKAKRAELKNGTTPVGGGLPEADTADMETFYENIRLVVPVLGVDVFSVEAPAGPGAEPSDELRLELRWEAAHAECVVRDGQLVVVAQSTARVKEVESLGKGTRELRKKLLSSGVLEPDPGDATLLRFAQEYAFDSPSAAAGAVTGTGLNGRVHWKVKGKDISYKEWEAQQVETEAGPS